ncbi:MAG: hypothetical protein LIP23_02070, partial [Planctomycetes bacterium]|nr:hypothetical protein [Planctomycetota bacterium]
MANIRTILWAAALVFAALCSILISSTIAAEPAGTDEYAAILRLAEKNDPLSLTTVLEMRRSNRWDREKLIEAAQDNPDLADIAVQIQALAGLVETAEYQAQTALADPNSPREGYQFLVEAVLQHVLPRAELAYHAADLIDLAQMAEKALVEQRIEVLTKLGNEVRRNRTRPGTRLAWALIRAASGSADTRVEPYSLRYTANNAEMKFIIAGVPVHAAMDAADHQSRVRASAYGFRFSAGWALLLQKPLGWMAEIASGLHEAGVDSTRYPSWEIMEGAGGLVAMSERNEDFSVAPDRPRLLYYQGKTYPLTELPRPHGFAQMEADFLAAAEQLHVAVMEEESVPRRIRQALLPILAGAYLPIDERDYFDAAFCRRLLEADYLGSFINPLPAGIADALERYRTTLGKLEAGYDRFAVTLDAGERLVAIANPDHDPDGTGKSNDRDSETGESIPLYTWRLEQRHHTIFYSPMPARSVYALSLAEHYDGPHAVKPAGRPVKTEVWHAVDGLLVSYRQGEDSARGDAEKWNAALARDRRGGMDRSSGEPGWNFPPHVLVRDDQGDPLSLATLRGIVPSPDFTAIADEDERRAAQDKWLDLAAETLATPGELGLIFHQFFRYCSDSPLPDLPNLIGSHYGLSDTHQTVYQSLDRRWVGRLIGDCDDLAEFFQELALRQGKLCHVMQVPRHAAAGYVEQLEDGHYRFIVLQTGPVLQFTSPSLYGAVEAAYMHFNDEGGRSRFTLAAVPLLLRFADEDTRTGFVLSARIYADREYAENMILVQEYWHRHVFSAAIKVMEKMVAEDPELGSIKELGSLYQRVGLYKESAAMRRNELEAASADPTARLSTLLDIVLLHVQEGDRRAIASALDEMENELRTIRDDHALQPSQALPFTLAWAGMAARYGSPTRAWEFIRPAVAAGKKSSSRLPEQILRTIASLYEGARLEAEGKLDSAVQTHTEPDSAPDRETALDEMRRELDDAFARSFFRPDDSYPTIIRRYHMLGRYAVSRLGRDAGIAKLLENGPYPSAQKNHADRSNHIYEADWEWFRISSGLYLYYAEEMLNQTDHP